MSQKFFAPLISFVFGVMVVSCGATTTSSSSFKVRMHGIYAPPVGAEGESTPRSQTYLLESVNLTQSDGTEVALYSGDPATLKIIDRGQLIFSDTDTSDYDGVSFTSAKVTVDPTVVVTSKEGKSSTITLSSGDLQLDETFTIEKNKERVLTIKIAWGDTITVGDDGTETISPPTFSLAYDDGD